MKNKITTVGVAALVLIWLALTGFAWFGESKEVSVSERRKLDQWPGISVETLLDGTFMEDFEDYTLDQFPLRDTFRQVKSLFHYNVMQQMDNNDIYIVDGVAAKLLYPLDEGRLNLNLKVFETLYRNYLNRGKCNVYVAVVPDKSYYLAEENGYLALDYDAMFAAVKQKMPWATHIDLTGTLDISDYYRTDTHWRQEEILPVAQKLLETMGMPQLKEETFTKVPVDREFYGVYYGHAALPMDPEQMYLMQSEILQDCKVFDFETNSYTDVYNMEKIDAWDPYDIFLSGARALLRIENPNATTDRELIVFRDSFGSSLSPLLVQDYATVTVVDLRYVSSQALEQYIKFNGQDILFLYNTQVLNSTPLR